MGKLTMEDVFRALAKPLPEFELKPGRTALVLVDFQKLVGSEGLLGEALKAGLPEMVVKEALREYEQRVRKAVENAERILKACRRKGYDVVHVARARVHIPSSSNSRRSIKRRLRLNSESPMLRQRIDGSSSAKSEKSLSTTLL